MTYTPRKRDRYRRLAASATAATTVGALTLTGWLSGVAASDYAAQQAKQTADEAAVAAKAERAQARYAAALAQSEGPRIVYRERPIKKRVTIQYVTSTPSSSSIVGSGGSIASSTAQSAPAGQSSGAGGQGHAAAPPPPPPPPPAPSTGS